MPRCVSATRAALVGAVLASPAGGQTATPSTPARVPPRPAATSVAPTAAPDTADAYAGRYADSPTADMVLSIYREGGRYFLQPTENPRFELAPAGADTFDVPAIRHRIVFVRGAGAQVTALRMRTGDGRELPPTPRLDRRPDVVRFAELTRTDTVIPMRDGTRLHTVIFTPAGAHGPLPILLERTPYGVAHWDPTRVNVVHRALVADRGGYVFVFQDVRGRFGSGGAFAMFRPPARPGGGVDESTDAYDTVDWLVRHVPGNNGRVGIRGISYGGWLATMALRGPHPALAAASPQAPVGDLWRGDDFFHNGAFRLSYGYEFAAFLETARDSLTGTTYDAPPGGPPNAALNGPPDGPPNGARVDAYDWYLRHGPLSALTARAAGRLPTWTDFTRHPDYDAFWRARAVDRQVNRPGDRRVPTLVVGGRWDQEDPFGPLVTYATLERGDTAGTAGRGVNNLVLGPWHHGQWSQGPGRRLGALEWGSATGTYFRDSLEAPWFAHHLKARPRLRCPRRSSSARAPTGGSVTPSGRPARGRRARCTSARAGASRSSRPAPARVRTRTSPTRPTRCRTAPARSAPPSPATRQAGGRGSPRTSASRRRAPTCAPGARRRSPRT
jgi:predicted acyl esterase